MALGQVGDDHGQGRLAGAGGTPEEDGRKQAVGFDCPPQQLAGTDDVLLTEELFQRARAHTGGEGSFVSHPVVHGVGEEVQSGSAPKSIKDHMLDLAFQPWQIMLDNLPHNFLVDSEIMMRQAITGSCHISPRNIQMLAFKFIRQILGCLANHLEISNDRILCLMVTGIFVPVHARGVFQDVIDRLLDIQ